MILPDFNDFPRVGRIVGIDWGGRRIGVAVSDENRDFVFSRPVILSDAKEDLGAKKVADFIKSEKVCGIVIGLPVRSDGTESETTKSVRAFAANLCTYIDLPIVFIDETLTSMSAQESMGKVRVSDIKTKLDSESARVILENAIAVIKRLK